MPYDDINKIVAERNRALASLLEKSGINIGDNSEVDVTWDDGIFHDVPRGCKVLNPRLKYNVKANINDEGIVAFISAPNGGVTMNLVGLGTL